LFAPLRSEVADVWGSATFTLTSNGPRDGHRRLYRGQRRLLRTPTWARVFNDLVGEVNGIAVERCRYLAIHAGVVASPTGAIAFPGASGAGKSTLTAACVLEGLSYVSDEALCLDLDSGLVIPYPKPLGLSAWTREILGVPDAAPPFAAGGRKAVVPAEDLGAVAGPGPLRLASLVVPERNPGQARLTELTRGEVVFTLLRSAFNHYTRPEAAFRVATRVAVGCRAWRLRFEDPLEAAQLVLRELA
jgi:hypothetical protein